MNKRHGQCQKQWIATYFHGSARDFNKWSTDVRFLRFYMNFESSIYVASSKCRGQPVQYILGQYLLSHGTTCDVMALAVISYIQVPFTIWEWSKWCNYSVTCAIGDQRAIVKVKSNMLRMGSCCTRFLPFRSVRSGYDRIRSYGDMTCITFMIRLIRIDLSVL